MYTQKLRTHESDISKAENEVLKTQLERAVQNGSAADIQIQEARVQAEAREKQLLAKEQDLQAAQAEIKALRIQIRGLKKENAELHGDLQLAAAACNEQVRLANETANLRERMSRRGKRVRAIDEGDDLALPKRSRMGLTTEEGATELTSEEEHG
jgi:predicted RNase H-like nuclease (RuvC/YqgF family)